MNPRTCIGCRRAVARGELVRLVWSPDAGVVVVDAAANLPGRGAWLHPDAGCAAAALKRRAVGRALRRRVDAAQVEQVLAGVGGRVDSRNNRAGA